MRTTGAGVVALGLWTVAGSAAAHPHVWIDVTAELTVADGRLAEITVEWTLDLMLSAVLIHDFDRDRDGRLDTAEQQVMAEHAFADVADYGFFTHLRADGALVGLHRFGDFAARIEDDQVVYRFLLAPTEPVSPVSQAVALAFYDESFYIEMTVADDAFVLAGASAGQCGIAVGPDAEHPIFFGLVLPTKADLTCGVSG